MGREVRRVPPNWEHPRYTEDDAPRADRVSDYRPCLDADFSTAAQQWIANFDLWRKGEHPDQRKEYWAKYEFFWQIESPPNEDCYRPAFEEEPTWFQMYETVSEGTPVSPPFETEEELARYLSENGDFWCQKRPHESPPAYEQALRTVKAGHAFSLIMSSANGVQGPYEQ